MEGNRFVQTVFYIMNAQGAPAYQVNKHAVTGRRWFEAGGEKLYVCDLEVIYDKGDALLLKCAKPLVGIKPLKTVHYPVSDAVYTGALIGYQSASGRFNITACQWKKRSDDTIVHNASTQVGDCGRVLVDARGSVIGLHFSGQSGDSKYPNEVYCPFGPVKK